MMMAMVVMMRRWDAHGRGKGQQPQTRHKGGCSEWVIWA